MDIKQFLQKVNGLEGSKPSPSHEEAKKSGLKGSEPPPSHEEAKKSGLVLLQDAALIIAALTALTYLFAYSFQKGKREYYGIGDMALSNLDINAILDSISDVSTLIFYVIIIYFFARLIVKVMAIIIKYIGKSIKELPKNENLELDELEALDIKGTANNFIMNYFTNLFFISLVIGCAPYLILGIGESWDDYLGVVAQSLSFVVCIFMVLSFIYIGVVVSEKNFNLLAVIFFKNPITYIMQTFSLMTRIILIATLCIGSAYTFYQYGYTKAVNKKDYMVIQANGKNFLLLDKDANRMLVAPIKKLGKKGEITKRDFQLIEMKLGKNNNFIIKKYEFENGLQVNPDERNVYLRELGRDVQKSKILKGFLPWDFNLLNRYTILWLCYYF
ncbi:hypothetical protein [Peribacillus frigoritolerans]|uniref:Uncharacterized protein n=1 Tax=Peribacillus frigoritolerans TaxID=450367 RepID=A0AAJ1QMC9_9BACI|nr:hypothetical protein [Peribacillus frigoritolerans]MDM5284003.1 hypothetical protein [Peribacillus frigoritolerans]